MPVCYGSGGCGNVFKRVEQRGAVNAEDDSAQMVGDQPARKPLARRKRSDYDKPHSRDGSRIALSVIERDLLAAVGSHGGCYLATTALFARELQLSRKAFQESKRYLEGLGLLSLSCLNDDSGATRCVEYRLTERGAECLAGTCDPFAERKEDDR